MLTGRQPLWGTVGEMAAERKLAKYSNLAPNLTFQPIAVENLDAFGLLLMILIQQLLLIDCSMTEMENNLIARDLLSDDYNVYYLPDNGSTFGFIRSSRVGICLSLEKQVNIPGRRVLYYSGTSLW